jgi:N-acetylneuraminic acid mutarotase
MKNIRIVFSLFLLPLTLSAAPIPYSGKVAINGLNFQGDAQFTFVLRDANGTVHWRNGADADSSINVPVDRGLYVVLLGGQGMDPIPSNLFLDHPELYLQVRFYRPDTQEWLHMQPDQRITSAPHALAADVANLAKLADAVKPGAIPKSMLAADVLADLSATVVLPELNATITSGSITAGQLAPALLADLNRSVVITRNMLPASVLADLNRTLSRTDLPADVLADLNRTIVISRDMLPASVLSDLNGTIPRSRLSAGVLADLNRTIAITRDMLPGDVLADLNKTITRNMLPADVLADLNASPIQPGSITAGMLAPGLLADLNASVPAGDGNGTVAAPAGSLIAVQHGQSAPAGYSLYQQGEPKTLVWEEKAPVSVARFAYDGVEVLDGKIYFVGGYDSSAKNTAERYDPNTNQWETLNPMSTARYGHAAAVFNGKLYAIGGKGLSSVEVFDPQTGQWSAGPALPSEVNYLTAITVGGKILLVGGRNASDQNINQVLEFDPATNQWSQKAGMPTARHGMKLVLLEGRIWAIGGNDGSNTSKVEIYDVANNSWTTAPSLTSARHLPSAWMANGRIYVAGGFNGSYLNSIEFYDPVTNQWVAAGNLPENKYGADATVLNGKVYLVAGWRDQSDNSNKVHAADLNATTAGVFDLYRRDGNASAGGTTVSSEFSDGSVTPSKLSAEVVAALKPVILQQPQSITAVGGTSATFVTQATGGNLSYQWLQQGYAIAGGNGNVLTIPDLNATLHDGNYSVTVTNAFGSTESAVATLEVDDSLMQGLVGWWKFDENNGTVATDSSGNGNNGTLINGPTWATGKIGGALSFDGLNDYVDAGNDSVLDVGKGDFSLAAWILSSHTDFRDIVAKRNPSSFNGWVFQHTHLSVRLWANATQLDGNFPSNVVGSWQQLVVVREKSLAKGTHYHDGKSLVSSSYTSADLGNPGKLSIGRLAEEDTQYFHGLIDDVRIYDRALSAAEVTALYNLGSGTSTATTSGGGTTIVADSGPVTTEKLSDGAITTAKLSETILKYLRPEITVHPQSATVYADTNASFSVSAEGKYLTYQWKKAGVNLTGETNATLTITDANATLHDGNYTVVVSNDFGSVEAPFNLDVINAGSMNGLVGWWRFDETSGMVAHDSSGNDSHGAFGSGSQAPTRVTGKIGGALSFDGVNDFVSINSANIPNNPTNITQVAWVKSSSITPTQSVILTRRHTAYVDHDWPTLMIVNGNILISGDDDGANSSASSTSNVCNGVWRFVVGIKSGTQYSLYVDGFLDGSLINPHVMSGSNEDLHIGHHGAWNKYFTGLLDEVRIYDRALSAAEVQALYNLGQ